MKTIKLLLLSSILIISQFAFAQTTQEKFKVSGECGMCKTSIEKAAKKAGATFADWNTDTKELTVKYESKSSNAAKIQQTIAGIGYDTPGFKATDEAYNKLHGCCKYVRTSESENKAKMENCCKDGKCEMNGTCCKDGKCELCKDGKCDGKECKDGECKHHSETRTESTDCCKDGATCCSQAAACCKKA